METKRVECMPNCSFSVESDDLEEIESILIRHARTAHHLTLTHLDVYKMTRVVPDE